MICSWIKQSKACTLRGFQFLTNKSSNITDSKLREEAFLELFGSRHFEWKISMGALQTVDYVLLMRKFEPLRDIINSAILKINEASLLHVAKMIVFIPENENPRM